MSGTGDTLTPRALEDQARAVHGLDDYGDDSYREPLAVLTESLVHEAGLSAAGLVAQRQRLIGSLGQRLRLEAWVRREPAILEERVDAPVVIVGLPRTGTTMLYRMLAVAAGFSAPLHYEAIAPAPPFDWDFEPETDPRVAAAEASIAAMLEASPELNAIYPFEALAPEESIFLLSPALRCTSAPSSARVTSYLHWFLQADKRPAYRYLRRTLQLLQWQRRVSRPERAPGRWLLKTPDHLHSLDALLEEFPGARIIQTHRDPLQTIPSICSFIRALHEPYTSEVDTRAIGRDWSTMFAGSTAEAINVRQRHPEAFHDVWYEDTVARSRQVAEGVFAFLGRNLDDEVWNEMQRWREANRREARPAHNYRLENFGLTEQGIEQQFAPYRERYIVGRQS